MEDSLTIIFTFIIAVLLMFIFPLMDTWERQDDMSYMLAYSKVVDFVDSARNTGYFTQNMLDQLENDLTATGNIFEIQLECRRLIYGKGGQIGYLYSFNEQIEKELSESSDQRFVFDKGDYFYVSVRNTNKTQSTLVKEFMYSSSLSSFKIGVPYGGMIRNSVTL